MPTYIHSRLDFPLAITHQAHSAHFRYPILNSGNISKLEIIPKGIQLRVDIQIISLKEVYDRLFDFGMSFFIMVQFDVTFTSLSPAFTCTLRVHTTKCDTHKMRRKTFWFVGAVVEYFTLYDLFLVILFFFNFSLATLGKHATRHQKS